MVLKTNGTTTLTRYYFGSQVERDVVGSSKTNYFWIGGDAYTAVAVAKKTSSGTTVYNIFRDHLGTITHLKSNSGTNEYSFDAWGRRRDNDTWSYTLSNEPALFANRGFTAHEHLEDFNLINMNGRLYDPVVGRFLSPDRFVQAPEFSQSYNRYSYCLNNPLAYTDFSGDKWDWNWLNPFHWMDRSMQWINDKTPGIRQRMTDLGLPSFGFGVNSAHGTFHYIGNSGNVYHNQLSKQIAEGEQRINAQINSFRGLSKSLENWISDHIFADIEFRIDKGLQLNLHANVLGTITGVGYEHNTEPLAQLNFGYNSGLYGEAYSIDNPHYAYGSVTNPIRNSWAIGAVVGAQKTYDSNRKLFKFGTIESESISWGCLNISSIYNRQGELIQNNYFWGIGFNLSAILGINFNIDIGYKQNKH